MAELSKEAIERLRQHSTALLLHNKLQGFVGSNAVFDMNEATLALIAAHARLERENAELMAERERLVAVAEASKSRVCGKRGCPKCGHLADKLDDWKATVKP